MDTFSAANQSGLINCIKDIRKKLDPPPVSGCVCVCVCEGGGERGGGAYDLLSKQRALFSFLLVT